MHSFPQKYYLCTSGEVKKKAEEFRKEFLVRNNKLWAIVKAFGATEASINRTMMLIRAIKFKGEPPKGWTVKNKYGLSRPKRGTLEAEVCRSFTPNGSYAIEPWSGLKTFRDWLGCPFHYSYKKGKGESGGNTIGRLFAEDFVYWYDPKGPILLELPDVALAKARAKEREEIVDNDVLDWKPPKGLKEILIEEWNLMQAKYEKANPE